MIPSLMLFNVMSLVPKIDELAQVLKNNNVDLVFIAETWLKDKIPDNVIRISDFKVFRRDRKDRAKWGLLIHKQYLRCYSSWYPK